MKSNHNTLFFLHWLSSRRKKQRQKRFFSLLSLMKKKQDFDEATENLINRSMALVDVRVHDVMIPMVKIETISFEDGLDAAIERFRESGFSRLPVTDSKGHICGVLLLKDVFLMRPEEKGSLVGVKDLMRKVHSIPESRRCVEVLRDFRMLKEHLMVVLDEYAKPSGIITIEDIVEEIVGEIEDEHDQEEEEIRLLDAQKCLYWVHPEAEIEYLNKIFHTSLDTTYGTLSGWFLDQLEYLPKVGEEIDSGGIIIRVAQAGQRRVLGFHVLSKSLVSLEER